MPIEELPRPLGLPIRVAQERPGARQVPDAPLLLRALRFAQLGEDIVSERARLRCVGVAVVERVRLDLGLLVLVDPGEADEIGGGVAVPGAGANRGYLLGERRVTDQLLLMDEPFSGLDPAALEDVMKLLVDVANLHELNTILVVTHDIRAAMAVSDTVYMLGRDRKDDGRIVPGARVQATYDLVALDLAWKTDVQTLPTFVALEREIKAKFRTL